MRVLIGYDGSDCAEAALDDLQRAGLPKSAEALVVSVTELAFPFPPPSTHEIVELAREIHVPADLSRAYATASSASQEAQTLAERAATRLRASFPSWTINAEGAVGSPASELIKRSDEFTPDLIIVGSHGRSKLESLVLGSVSQRVLSETNWSVRVARGRVEEPDTPVRIVVGVDSSPASKAAVHEVASRLWPQKSEVRLITAADRLTPTFLGGIIPPVGKIIDEINQTEDLWLEEELEQLSRQFEQTELTISTEIVAGNPKRELINAAERWAADCIFVGSGNFSNRLERFVLGSVSQAVASRARCSVEVVRPRQPGHN
ncbi:MAG TPA: universal stress protein [Pyrinomonadaceae bacterium]|nr:universal stress protein [Pyrinomonadaceae bacterium]